MSYSLKPEEDYSIWDKKYKKVQEGIKESLWSDFLIGGVLISGIFIIVDNLNFTQEIGFIVGGLIILFSISLMIGRLLWIRKIPQRISTKIERAKNLFENKKYEKSLRYLEKAYKINKQGYAILNNIGITLRKLGRIEEAIECYIEILKYKVNYVDAWFNKGNALLELERYEEAIEDYKKVLLIKKVHFGALLNKGIVLARLKRYEEAIEDYNKAIEFNERNIISYHFKGMALFKLGRKKEAIECLNKAIEFDKNYLEFLKTQDDKYIAEYLKT